MIEINLLRKKKAKPSNILMHFDGPNLSNAFTDEYKNSISLVGTPNISTTRSKFGGASGFFNAGGLNLVNPISLPGDYTIECWIYLEALPTGRIALTQQSSTTNASLLISSSGIIGYWLEGSTTGSTMATAGITIGKWIHIASSRKGGIYRLFSEGIKKFESGLLPVPVIKIDKLIQATGTSTEKLNGYVDELYVLDGTARYIDNFTPPNAPFTI